MCSNNYCEMVCADNESLAAHEQTHTGVALRAGLLQMCLGAGSLPSGQSKGSARCLVKCGSISAFITHPAFAQRTIAECAESRSARRRQAWRTPLQNIQSSNARCATKDFARKTTRVNMTRTSTHVRRSCPTWQQLRMLWCCRENPMRYLCV